MLKQRLILFSRCDDKIYFIIDALKSPFYPCGFK